MRSLTYLLIAGLVVSSGVLIAGCPAGKPHPVDIVLSEDACAECRMAVSDKKFAAEIVSADGHVDYFDDIGCMVLRLRAKPPAANCAVYVVDFKSGAWLDYQEANYLWAKSLPTPMSYGLAAFSSPAEAQAAIAQWPGEVLQWSALLEKFEP